MTSLRTELSGEGETDTRGTGERLGKPEDRDPNKRKCTPKSATQIAVTGAKRRSENGRARQGREDAGNAAASTENLVECAVLPQRVNALASAAKSKGLVLGP
jgi:hypothetical protein